jgi:hypothetical protein
MESGTDMAINFPDVPTLGQFFTFDETTWVWAGTHWDLVPTNYDTNQLLPSQLGNTDKYLKTDGTNASWQTVSGGVSLISSTTFTAASVVNINNVFSSTYKDYQIRISGLTVSYIGKVMFRLRVGGVDNTSSLYAQTNMYLGTTSSVNLTTQTAGHIFSNRYLYGSPGYQMEGGMSVATITNPFETVQTSWLGSSYDRQQTYSTNDLGVFGGNHNSATSYTGFTIYHETGQPITGRLSVYGLQT